MADVEGKKTGGRVKGVKNKEPTLKAFVRELIANNTDKLTLEISKLTGKPYVDAVMGLMEYAVPKLSRTELTAEIDIVEFVDLSKFEIKDLKKSIESNKITN